MRWFADSASSAPLVEANRGNLGCAYLPAVASIRGAFRCSKSGDVVVTSSPSSFFQISSLLGDDHPPAATAPENDSDTDNWEESDVLFERSPAAMSPPNFLEEEEVLPSDHPVQRLEYRCPPGGERRVVLYLTSLRGIRKTYDNCRQLKLLLKAFGVAIDERDVALHAGFRKELEDLLGEPLPVPRLFIKGLYVGGAEDVVRLHEEGRLVSLLPEFRLARQMSWNPEFCKGCGGLRFIPCLECNGSRKVRDENDEIARCPDCNENGLMKCPVCFS